MGLAFEIAKRAQAMRYEDLPPEAIHWAKVGILDTIGVTLAGSREDAARLVERALVPGAGPSVVFGSDRRAGPLDAAAIRSEERRVGKECRL